MRVVMFIASRYGLECYRAIEKIENIHIVGILTTPPHFVLRYGKDKAKEMDNEIISEVIKESEIRHVPVHVTDKMNDKKTVSMIRGWKPELIVVSGWYHIIKDEVLEMPPKGIIGLHASLLPRYRGGAPLVWQIINDEKKAGITLFYMERGTDTGDVIGQSETVIEENDDIGTLYKKIGEKGIELLQEYIPQIAEDIAPRRKQTGIERHCVYPQRKPEDGRIEWSKGTRDIYNFVRAQTKPYPGAFSIYEGYQVYIWKCSVVKIEDGDAQAGTIIDVIGNGRERHPVIAVGEGGFGVKILDYSFQNGEDIRMEIGKRLM